MTGTCVVCSNIFTFYPSNRSGRYCSAACSHSCPDWREKQAAAKRGKKMSAEARANMSTAHRGKAKPAGFGARVSATLKGRSVPWATGERSHWWRGGLADTQKRIRASREYRNWRRAVLDRDRRCVNCESTTDLQADHVTPFGLLLIESQLCSRPEWLHQIDNGRTLCGPCHRATPTYSRKIQDSPEGRLIKAIVATTPQGRDSGDFYQEQMDELIASALKELA